QHFDHTKNKVEHARDQMPLLQREVKRLDGSLRDVWELRRKRATLQRLEQGEMLALQQRYEWYLLTEQKLNGLSRSATERREAMPGALTSRFTFDAPWSEQEPPTPVAEALAGVGHALKNNAAAESESTTLLQQSLQG